jgi:myo-inositol-1(or 4)-monophosphatase
LILDELRKLADLPMLSEERGSVGSHTISSDYVWIVDPLDGTMNYFRGVPASCVSIALWRADVPVLGVLYSLDNNQMFTGIVGEGAWMDGQPIHVSETKDVNERDAFDWFSCWCKL